MPAFIGSTLVTHHAFRLTAKPKGGERLVTGEQYGSLLAEA